MSDTATTATTSVEILGPLGGAGDDFHVHAAACADVRKKRYNGHRREWVADVGTFREVVEEIYSDFIFANDRQPWEDYADGVRVFPCVGDLR